jgi:hypothetical protein
VLIIKKKLPRVTLIKTLRELTGMPFIRNYIKRLAKGLYQKSATSEIFHIQELEQYDPIIGKYPSALFLLARLSARYSSRNTLART